MITLVSFNSRITAMLVQSVNDRSLSRYWKNRCRALSKRSYATRSHRSRALPSICCHQAFAALSPNRNRISVSVSTNTAFIAGTRPRRDQWTCDRPRTIPRPQRAKQRLAHATIDGVAWYRPADETPQAAAVPEGVRLLAPFDPVVWDRRRFELLWGWAYRFEAYTPVKRRKFGYYALPLLWSDRVIGWANVSATNGTLDADIGYVAGRQPRGRAFGSDLDVELDRLRAFLVLSERPRVARLKTLRA